MDNIDKDETGQGTTWIISIRTKLVQGLMDNIDKDKTGPRATWIILIKTKLV